MIVKLKFENGRLWFVRGEEKVISFESIKTEKDWLQSELVKLIDEADENNAKIEELTKRNKKILEEIETIKVKNKQADEEFELLEKAYNDENTAISSIDANNASNMVMMNADGTPSFNTLEQN